MTVLSQLLSMRSSLENPQTPLSQAFDFFEPGVRTEAGTPVGERHALGYPPFWRGVNLISADVSKLPLRVYERTEQQGRRRAIEHPAWTLLRRKPNPLQTSSALRRQLTLHALVYGNGLAEIDRDGAARPTAIWPLDPKRVTMVRRGERLFYVVTDDSGGSRVLRSENVLHIAGLGYDGLSGYPVVSLLAEALGLGIAAQRFGAKFFGRGSHQSVVIRHPGALKPEARERLRKSWQSIYGGLENAHGVAVLCEGAEVTKVSVDPEAAQYIETRKFEIRDVANILGLPPHLLGDDSRISYNSLEQENQAYLDRSLDHWLCLWEDEAADKLLSEEELRGETHFIEHDRAALLSTDLKSRWEAYRVARDAGFMSADEIRARENMPPLGRAGELYWQPLNVAAVDGDANIVIAPSQRSEPIKRTHTSERTERRESVATPPSRSASNRQQAAQTINVLLPAVQQLVNDVRDRAWKRLAVHVVKMARQPATFLESLEQIEREHLAVVQRMLEPAARVVAGLLGNEDACRLRDRWTGLLFDSARDLALDVSGRETEETLAAGIEEAFADLVPQLDWEEEEDGDAI